MRSIHYGAAIAISAPVLLSVLATGCATKKFVTNRIHPVEQRVTVVERKSNEQEKTIDTLEGDLNKTRERVLDLDSNLSKTSQRLDQVSSQTQQASDTAQKAQQQAAENRAYAETRTTQLKQYVDAIDNFKLAKTASVLFSTGKSALDDDAKSSLDEMAQDALSRKKFVFEIEGFTDSKGSQAANLLLSQRRAESVVRYLTMEQKVPLRTIHLIGAGNTAPVANNRTAEGRRQNRRVEIRLFAPEVEPSSALTSAHLR
ncbi:MAG: OmpA family protein [Bryobacterales bacterium]|nr:OmpA family protein [Bryobacterales bacterium]